MVDFFIHRPVFATVCALLIILAGAVCIPTLPISLYPTLAPPQVTVTSNYVGANAQTVESAVTIPLEQQINGVQGMRYISSTSSNDGTSAITTTFQTGYSLDIAAVDVQNRVSAAAGRLPQVVNNTGITITKANSNFVFAAAFFSPDNRYSDLFISNYLDVYVKDALKRIPGVGDVVIFGERRYAMRLWLDPARLAARGLTSTDVTNALAEQNVEIPAGQVGQPPSDEKQTYQIPVRVIGRLSEPAEFDNIIVKNSTGGIVQLKDVGYAEIGAETYSTDLNYNGAGRGRRRRAAAEQCQRARGGPRRQGRVGRTVQIFPARPGVPGAFRHHHGHWRFHPGSRRYAAAKQSLSSLSLSFSFCSTGARPSSPPLRSRSL